MAITNHERVGKALDLLKAGLGPFVEREVQGAIESGKQDACKLRRFADDPPLANKPIPERDGGGLRVGGSPGARGQHWRTRCSCRDRGSSGWRSGVG